MKHHIVFVLLRSTTESHTFASSLSQQWLLIFQQAETDLPFIFTTPDMKNFPVLYVFSILTAIILTGCHHHRHTAAQESSRMELTLRLPSTGLPEYTATSRTGYDSDEKHPLRAIVEVSSLSSGNQKILRKECLPPINSENESYSVEIDLEAGIYDIYIWTDRVVASAPTADYLYNTSDLRSVTTALNPYVGMDNGKEAAYAVMNAIRHTDAGSSHNVYLQYPFAKYRLITNDVRRYNEFHKINPTEFPALSELRYRIDYEYFFPTSFNLTTGKTNDSAAGISYTTPARGADGYEADEAVMIAGDVVFSDDIGSFLSLTLTITDQGGRIIAYHPGIRIDYRKGFMTTVTGNFLTTRQTEGGVNISTDWDDDIIIHF